MISIRMETQGNNMGYRIAWSGGKDSTATVILAHQQGIEVDSIDYVDMRYNAHISAQLPFVADFIETASERFRQWGYKVRFLKPEKTAVDLAYQRFKRSKYDRNGLMYGCLAFMRMGCIFTKEKQNILPKHSSKCIVGIAIDEPVRLARLTNRNSISLLAYGNITEKECFDICRKEGLLNPIYNIDCFKRDGCFFCPNSKQSQIEYLKKHYPHHYKMALDLVRIAEPAIMAEPDGVKRCIPYSTWVKEYFNGKR